VSEPASVITPAGISDKQAEDPSFPIQVFEAEGLALVRMKTDLIRPDTSRLRPGIHWRRNPNEAQTTGAEGKLCRLIFV